MISQNTRLHSMTNYKFLKRINEPEKSLSRLLVKLMLDRKKNWKFFHINTELILMRLLMENLLMLDWMNKKKRNC